VYDVGLSAVHDRPRGRVLVDRGKICKNVHRSTKQALCTNLVQTGIGAINRWIVADTSLRPDFPGGREQN